MNFSVLIRTRGRLLRHYTGYNIFDFSQVPYITLNVVTYIPTDLSYIINTFKCYIISSRVTVHIIVSPCRTTYRQIPFDVHFDEYPFTGYRTFRMTIFFFNIRLLDLHNNFNYTKNTRLVPDPSNIQFTRINHPDHLL